MRNSIFVLLWLEINIGSIKIDTRLIIIVVLFLL